MSATLNENRCRLLGASFRFQRRISLEMDWQPMSKHKNLILVGFMGTGKTVVGQAAARALGFDYVDSDDLIERKAGKTISRIFAEDGEPHFRDLETEAIRSLAALDRHVVATGGGCVLRDENWEAMGRAGLVVCLAARPEIILERTRRESHRPLLQTPDPMARICELLARRAPFYARADYTIDTSNLSVDEIVARLLRVWEESKKDM
jgi:shikimate kinase